MQSPYVRYTRWLLVFSGISLLLYVGGFLHGRLTQGWGPLETWFTNLASDDQDHDHGAHGLSLREQAKRGHSSHDHAEAGGDEHGHEDGHDHGAADTHAHENSNALLVSETARKNLGLTDEYLQPITLRSFTRTLSVPSMIVDSPGRTRLPVSAPMTGIVTHVHAVPGEAVAPGDLILEMRLTHEDLVNAQKEYLQTLGDRDIELKQIARIEGLAGAGALSNKTLVERQFNRDKLESHLSSQREALRLHGLSESQITIIEKDRRLLTEIQIVAPHPDDHSEDELHLSLQKGQPLSANPLESEANPFRVLALTNHISQFKHTRAVILPVCWSFKICMLKKVRR